MGTFPRGQFSDCLRTLKLTLTLTQTPTLTGGQFCFWGQLSGYLKNNVFSCSQTITTCKISTSFEDLVFLNPRNHLNGKPVFSNGPKGLPKCLPDCLILCNWVFDSFILADELFAKSLRSLRTRVLVNNNLCRKLVSSLELPIIINGRLKVTSVPFLFLILIYEVLN